MIGSPLAVFPATHIHFLVTDGKREGRAVLNLCNVSNCRNVAFKIRVSDVKKYFVAPSCGALMPNSRTEVLILLEPGLERQLGAAGERIVIESVVLDQPPASRASRWDQHDQKFRQRILVMVNGSAGNAMTCDLPYLEEEAFKQDELDGLPELRTRYRHLLSWALELDREKRCMVAKLCGSEDEKRLVNGRLRASQKQAADLTAALKTLNQQNAALQTELAQAYAKASHVVLMTLLGGGLAQILECPNGTKGDTSPDQSTHWSSATKFGAHSLPA